MAPSERVTAVAAAAEAAKNEARRTGGVTGLSGVANLLPTSVVTSTARAAASRIDFATSNLRGAPLPDFHIRLRGACHDPDGPSRWHWCEHHCTVDER